MEYTCGPPQTAIGMWAAPGQTRTTMFFALILVTHPKCYMQLLYSKCVPVLLYGLEACPWNISDFRSLDFVIDRFFVKLFKTNNIDTVRFCQTQFGCQLPYQVSLFAVVLIRS